MAGAGVNAQNANRLIETGVDALHLSGSQKGDSRMIYRQPAVSMASSTPSEYEYMEASDEKIRAVVQQITL